MRFLQFAMLGALTLAGCSEATRPGADTTSRSETAADRDNTAANTRDRNGTTMTPLDQNENQPDIDITANIRKRVVDSQMSVDARNVKIITENGKVTLRGPVKSAEEKTRVDQIAADVAGGDNVDSQLDVK
jgi:hyperosmotically inducible periplasmic protein